MFCHSSTAVAADFIQAKIVTGVVGRKCQVQRGLGNNFVQRKQQIMIVFTQQNHWLPVPFARAAG